MARPDSALGGLFVSIPVLVNAQCVARQAPAVQQRLLDLCPAVNPEGEARAIRDLPKIPGGDAGAHSRSVRCRRGLSADLRLYIPKGRQTLSLTLGLRKLGVEQPEGGDELAETETPASRAGPDRRYSWCSESEIQDLWLALAAL